MPDEEADHGEGSSASIRFGAKAPKGELSFPWLGCELRPSRLEFAEESSTTVYLRKRLYDMAIGQKGIRHPVVFELRRTIATRRAQHTTRSEVKKERREMCIEGGVESIAVQVMVVLCCVVPRLPPFLPMTEIVNSIVLYEISLAWHLVAAAPPC